MLRQCGNFETEQLQPAYILETANGTTTARTAAVLRLDNLGTGVHALMLEDRPSVLPLGRLCMVAGYGFEWEAGHDPYLICPDGRRIRLDLDNLVPVLPVSVDF